MFLVQQIVRKLKTIGLKAGSKRKSRINSTCPRPVDDVGYEASSLIAQDALKKERRKP